MLKTKEITPHSAEDGLSRKVLGFNNLNPNPLI